jgi:hypothetical protein
MGCRNWMCSEVELFLIYGELDKDKKPMEWMINMIDRWNNYHRRK